jgi:hypothetical protein
MAMNETVVREMGAMKSWAEVHRRRQQSNTKSSPKKVYPIERKQISKGSTCHSTWQSINHLGEISRVTAMMSLWSFPGQWKNEWQTTKKKLPHWHRGKKWKQWKKLALYL